MKKVFLLLLAAALLLSCSGCTVLEEAHAFAADFPDKHWEKIWVIKERKTHLFIAEENVFMEGYCVIEYLGEEPAHDVRVIIRSPLTYGFIPDSMARYYGTVNPGDKLEYMLKAEFDNWQELIPTYIFEEKIMDDFHGNFYVGISWRQDEREYKKRFFEWKKEKKK